MAQVYVIYLRSNPTVHDVLSTRRTAEEDFKQFSHPKPDSYVDRRKRARPDLYTDMNDVDFLVLQPPSSWSNQERGDAVASWRSRPTEVLAAIRSALGSKAVAGIIAISAAPTTSSTGALSETHSVSRRTERPRFNDPDVEFDFRLKELMCTEGRQVQSVYPPEVRRQFRLIDGSPRWELYLTKEELLELRDMQTAFLTRAGLNAEEECFREVSRLLAFHEPLLSQQGHP